MKPRRANDAMTEPKPGARTDGLSGGAADGTTPNDRPRGMRGRLRRRRGRAIPGLKVLPTMMTMANLVCGFAAIYYSARAGEGGGPTPFGWHPLTVAGVLVFLGMAFDAVDGSLARLTHSTSDLGAQLDSLADVVTFGVPPSLALILAISIHVCAGPLRRSTFAAPHCAWRVSMLKPPALLKTTISGSRGYRHQALAVPLPASPCSTNTWYWSRGKLNCRLALVPPVRYSFLRRRCSARSPW